MSDIAVLIGEIGYISHSVMLEGLKKKAKESGDNLYLFTCEGFVYERMEKYIKGEYKIFELPCMDRYDGVIVDLTSTGNEETANKLKKRIEDSEIPCVSLDVPVKNADLLRYNNEPGFVDLVDHLLEHHGVTDFVFLSGPADSVDSVIRKNILFEEAKKHGIIIPESNVYYGEYNYDSGVLFVDEYLKKNRKLPQAFVAANDYMAIGIMSELHNRGYSVPEDVLVTGYDNKDVSMYTRPPLTTVERREYESGELCFELIKERINGRSEPRECVLDSRFIPRGSGGCKMDNTDTCVEYKFIEQCVSSDSNLDLIKNTSVAFSNIETEVEFDDNLEKTISKLNMEYFYFCQCGSRESYVEELDCEASGLPVERDIYSFSDMVWCPIACENGRWKSYTKSYPTKELFPPDSKYKKEGSYYVIMPVHQGEECIGYSIIGNFREDLSGRAFQHLVINFDQAIWSKRKRDLMKTMLAKINKKWQYDELTGIYNRSGMHVEAQNLLKKVLSNDTGVAVFFFDLDGLKNINDSQGHGAGDRYIKSMAKMLLSGSDENDVVVRYGGDEFLVFSEQNSEENCEKKLHKLNSHIVEPVKASCGYAFGKICNASELNELIAIADEHMYKEKKIRKKHNK